MKKICLSSVRNPKEKSLRYKMMFMPPQAAENTKQLFMRKTERLKLHIDCLWNNYYTPMTFQTKLFFGKVISLLCCASVNARQQLVATPYLKDRCRTSGVDDAYQALKMAAKSDAI
jgi:hypothetical protein